MNRRGKNVKVECGTPEGTDGLEMGGCAGEEKSTPLL